MKAQLFIAILLSSQVVFASPLKNKKAKATPPKKKEVVAKKVEPCATPTPAKLDPKTITLQGLGSSTGCKIEK